MINPTKVKKKLDLPVLTNSGAEYYYIGEAPPNAALDETVWTIKRITFTDGVVTDIENTSSKAIWNDRVSETYA